MLQHHRRGARRVTILPAARTITGTTSICACTCAALAAGTTSSSRRDREIRVVEQRVHQEATLGATAGPSAPPRACCAATGAVIIGAILTKAGTACGLARPRHALHRELRLGLKLPLAPVLLVQRVHVPWCQRATDHGWCSSRAAAIARLRLRLGRKARAAIIASTSTGAVWHRQPEPRAVRDPVVEQLVLVAEKGRARQRRHATRGLQPPRCFRM